MSDFNRLQVDANLVRLRVAMDADAAADRDDKGAVADELGLRLNGSSWRKVMETATVNIREIVEALQQSLDKIDQLTSRLEGRGFQKLCETAAANLERAEQAEANVQRLRESLEIVERLYHDKVAETEGS